MEAIREKLQADEVKSPVLRAIEKAEICPTCQGSGLIMKIGRAYFIGGKVVEHEFISVCSQCKGAKLI